jgi:hypothetical protein
MSDLNRIRWLLATPLLTQSDIELFEPEMSNCATDCSSASDAGFDLEAPAVLETDLPNSIASSSPNSELTDLSDAKRPHFEVGPIGPHLVHGRERL